MKKFSAISTILILCVLATTLYAAQMDNAKCKDHPLTGHAAVYGIYFDTGKPNVKPESALAISEIIKLLNADPCLKIHVVGHTDNVGGMESNIKLSQSRAESVVQALRNNGISPARLKSFGCGQFAPVMSNDNEEGRAKNRRVELVKQ